MTGFLEALKALVLALKMIFLGQQKLETHSDQKEVADAVEDKANDHRDAMRSADGQRVQPDDPGLFRD